MNRYRRLNGMQKMMLRWEAFHPLNAAHIVELGQAVSLTDIERAIRRSTRSLALAPVEFSKKLTEYRYTDRAYDAIGEYPTVELRRSTGSHREALQSVFNEELNRPFGSGAHWPWRFLQIEIPGAPTHLALIYHHAITDARGALLVIREVIRALFGGSVNSGELQKSAPEMHELFPHEIGWRGIPRRIAGLYRELTESLSCYRIAARQAGEETIVANLHGTSLSTDVVKQCARANGGTIQDLLYAALFEGLSLLFRDKLDSSRRKSLAIRAMIDLRREAPQDVNLALSQILGCIMVRLQIDPQTPFNEIVTRVNIQTQNAKAGKDYRVYASQLKLMSKIWDVSTEWMNRTFTPRMFPTVGMISNMNLTDFLAAEFAAGQIRNYFRMTGTGPLSPMMVSVTSVGSVMNVATTHHGNKFSESELLALGDHLQARMTGVSGDSAAPLVTDTLLPAPTTKKARTAA
jgi:hypothetical protein